MKKLKPLIVILGPTATGKTDIALKLAKKFNGEIISADSRIIYKDMNIGTAKPPQDKYQEKDVKQKNKTKNAKQFFVQQIPHYMIDIVSPNQEFTVGQFKRTAIQIIQNIQKRKKIPFLVGGTGLYINAICDNFQIPPVKPDYKLRKKLENEIEKYGLNSLWKQLLKLDPEAKNFVQEKNPRRIIRALEVCLKTKKSFSKLRKKGKPIFNILKIGISLPRDTVYERINIRVDKMIKIGLIDEVKNLFKKYSPNLPALSGIGYKEINLYLKNKISLKMAIELIKQNTRHYARRQIAWFKHDKKIFWINPVRNSTITSHFAKNMARKPSEKISNGVKNYHQAEKITNSFLKH